MTRDMSTKSRKKGKEQAKAVFVESSAPMTKSRNMAEENILRHKLKDLEDQRRRSILAFREEEKLLIRDLETQRRGSLNTPDSDRAGSKKEQLEVKYSNNSRRNSNRSSDENDNIIVATADMLNESINMNRRVTVNNNMEISDDNDADGRKHLWKYRKSSTIPTRLVDERLLRLSNTKCSKRTQSDDDRLHISDIVKGISSKCNKSSSCDNMNLSKSQTNSSCIRNDILSKSSEKPLSRSPLSRTKSIDKSSGEDSLGFEDRLGLCPEKTSTPKEGNRPTRPRAKLEERRDRSMMSLAKRAGSLKWSSFEDLDSQLNSAYGLIDKHTKRLSRSVNIKIGDEQIDSKALSFSSESTSDKSPVHGRLTKDVNKISNSLQNVRLQSQDSKPPKPTDSTSRNNNHSTLQNRSSQPFDNTLHRRSLDEFRPENNPNAANHQHKNLSEISNSQNELKSSPKTQVEVKSSVDSVKRNSIGRNKIMLSPIASRSTKLPTTDYVPSCAEKRPPVKKPTKKRRNTNEKKEPLKFTTVSHAPSADSDSGGSNVSRRGSIPDSDRKSSIPNTLSVRPVSSWSQRKRSIVFGEKSPQTPREVLNDTHAQWEELGDFLGEIRKQHNMDHARLSSARQNCRTGNSPVRQYDQSRRGSNFATLVEQRLLPRRHSESNIILLSQAARGKRDVLDLRAAGAPPSFSRRKSCIPPDHPCAVAGHSSHSTTSVKKLVTIHNALQSSALSMADMDSEMF